MPPRLVVSALPLGGPWAPIGTGVRRGVTSEEFQCSADLFGPLDASGTLKRAPRITWPDLLFGTPLKAEIDNQLVWAGQLIGAKGSDVGGPSISFAAMGWQGQLDRRPFSKLYATNALSAWTDIRSNTTVNLAQLVTVPTIANDVGGITMTIGQGDVRPASTGGGVFLDLGPNPPTNPRIVVSWQHAANDATSTLVICAANTVAALNSSIFANVATLTGTTSGTYDATVTGTNRFLALLLVDNSGGTTYTSPGQVSIKISAIQVFASAAYESGGASILEATDIFEDVLTRLPLISVGEIGQTAFPIPTFAATAQTPRDVLGAANAFQDWQFRIRADKVLEYRPKPTSPALALTDQTAFDDLSSGTGDYLYNEVTYTGTGPDGTPVVVTRHPSDSGLPATLLDRQGDINGYTIQSGAQLTAAAATQLCDVFLEQHNRTPFKGTVHATSPRSIGILPSGAGAPPYHLLRMPGELVTFRHLVDPDSGALGRTGRIAKATYTWSTNSAEVDIDSTPGSFEALSARLAVVTAR